MSNIVLTFDIKARLLEHEKSANWCYTRDGFAMDPRLQLAYNQSKKLPPLQIEMDEEFHNWHMERCPIVFVRSNYVPKSSQSAHSLNYFANASKMPFPFHPGAGYESYVCLGEAKAVARDSRTSYVQLLANLHSVIVGHEKKESRTPANGWYRWTSEILPKEISDSHRGHLCDVWHKANLHPGGLTCRQAWELFKANDTDYVSGNGISLKIV